SAPTTTISLSLPPASPAPSQTSSSRPDYEVYDSSAHPSRAEREANRDTIRARNSAEALLSLGPETDAPSPDIPDSPLPSLPPLDANPARFPSPPLPPTPKTPTPAVLAVESLAGLVGLDTLAAVD